MTQQLANTIETVVTSRIGKSKLGQKARSGACLIEISGVSLGRRVDLGERDALLFGRDPQCDVVLDDESASRRHARWQRERGEHFIIDLGSTNGTYVNDDLIERYQLRDGDNIRLGRTLFKYVTSNHVEAEYHEEIYRMMTTDSLTGTFNKRFFEEALDREISRSQRYDRSFSLALLDIDHFKQVNDTYGHLAGDAVLKRLGILLRGHVRKTDTVARLGGEEFGLLLPEVSLEGATAFAEKIRRMVDQAHFRFRGQSLPITVSLGVAEWQTAFSAPEDILKLADAKLYDAKRQGRNRVVSTPPLYRVSGDVHPEPGF